MDSLKDLIAITQKDNPRFVSLLYLDAMMKSPIQSRNPRISGQGHPEKTDADKTHTDRHGYANFKEMHDDIMAWRKARKRLINRDAGSAACKPEYARAFAEYVCDGIEHSHINKMKPGDYSRGQATSPGSYIPIPAMWPGLTSNPKENTMSTDVSILVKLAQADTQDEFTENLSSMPPQLREALEEQRRQESKEIYTAAAKLILRLYKDAEERTAYQVETIRKAREAEKVAKDKIAKIKRAKAYAEETNNYLPLALLTIGLNHGEHIAGDKLFVPLDWIEPVAEKPESATPKKAPAKK